MTEEEYWATDPSFSDESLHALADAGDYLLGLLSLGTRLKGTTFVSPFSMVRPGPWR
ncbi:MAG: hypothetical protein WB696_19190 [Chthoniobacterales bacterium]|jgi:hypothetical protein